MQDLRVVIPLLLAFWSASLRAAEIDKPLRCAVQQLTSIRVATNQTDPISIEKLDLGKAITVLYSINRQTGKLVEIYGAHSDIESVNMYSRGYSSGGTQYIECSERTEVQRTGGGRTAI